MTKIMLEELVKELKKKNKILAITIVILSVLLICMTAFAFSEFHVVYEKSTDYTVEQNADTQGDNSEIQQTIDMSENDNKVYVIAGAIILGLFILTAGGVFLYGKGTSKDNNKTESTGAYRKDIASQQEKKEVTDDGKTDED